MNVNLHVYVFVILFYERNWTVNVLNYDVTAVHSVIFSMESFHITALFKHNDLKGIYSSLSLSQKK